jgi:hypothetical protein
LHQQLLFRTVSFCFQETAMLKADLRYLYRPTRDRTPRWLRRIWTWL